MSIYFCNASLLLYPLCLNKLICYPLFKEMFTSCQLTFSLVAEFQYFIQLKCHLSEEKGHTGSGLLQVPV